MSRRINGCRSGRRSAFSSSTACLSLLELAACGATPGQSHSVGTNMSQQVNHHIVPWPRMDDSTIDDKGLLLCVKTPVPLNCALSSFSRNVVCLK